MKKLFLLFALSTLILSGCLNNASSSLDPSISITFTTSPGVPAVNDWASFIAKVDDKSKNADYKNSDPKVTFSIIQNGKVIKTLKATKDVNGYFVSNFKFKESGSYTIKTNVVIGERKQKFSDDIIVKRVSVSNKNSMQKTAAEDNHHSSNTFIHLQVDKELQANKPNKIFAHVFFNNVPLKGAKVKFEIWHDGDHKHKYFHTKETDKEGEYYLNYVPDKKGELHIKVHVEKDEIHEYMEEKVSVK